MKVKLLFFILTLSAFACMPVFADEVLLKNNDRITGVIKEESAVDVVLESEALGTIRIKKDSIASIVKSDGDPVAEQEINLTTIKEKVISPEKVVWKKDVALGYSTARGNTENEELALKALLTRKRKYVDEITFKGTVDYASANKKMDAQKWYGLGRYAFNIGSSKKWYIFCKFEGDHDKFADIDYRLVPAGGVGYWLYDTDIWKFLLECGLGYEYTVYNNETATRKQIILEPRIFLDRKIFRNFTVSEELVFYSPVNDLGKYRLRSETKLINQISDHWAIEFCVIDEYNVEPAEGAKENDLSVVAFLKYSY